MELEVGVAVEVAERDRGRGDALVGEQRELLLGQAPRLGVREDRAAGRAVGPGGGAGGDLLPRLDGLARPELDHACDPVADLRDLRRGDLVRVAALAERAAVAPLLNPVAATTWTPVRRLSSRSASTSRP